jgi:hypothetical protein
MHRPAPHKDVGEDGDEVGQIVNRPAFHESAHRVARLHLTQGKRPALTPLSSSWR